MTFREYALRNLQRAADTYLGFFAGATCAILIFFLFTALMLHPVIASRFATGPVRLVLAAGAVAVASFAVLFVLYSIATLLRKRSRELGLLLMLGATRRQLGRLVLLETVFLGTGAVAAAIALGLVFLKYFLMLASLVLEVNELGFYMPASALTITAVGFLLLFALASSLALHSVCARQVVDLFRSSRKPTPPPRPSPWLSLVSLSLLGTGYALVALQVDIPYDLIVYGALIALGTYLFYAQAGAYIVERQRSRPRIFLRKTNALWLSQLAHRMRDNALLLSVVTLTLALGCSVLAGFYSVFQTVDDEYARSYPIAFSYFSYAHDTARNANLDLIAQTLGDHGLEFEAVEASFIPIVGATQGPARRPSAVLSERGYNRLAMLLGREPVNVERDEAVEVSVWAGKGGAAGSIIAFESAGTVTLGDTSYRLTRFISDNIFPEGAFGRVFVVSEEAFAALGARQGAAQYYGFHVPQWKEAGAAALRISEAIGHLGEGFQYRSSPDWYKRDELTFKLILFVGAFVGLVFGMAALSFMYFRFQADVTGDRQTFRSLKRIGLTDRELKKAATRQLAVLFFVPTAVATAHTAFALDVLQARMAASILRPSLTIIAAVLAIMAACFFALRARYLAGVLR